MAVFLGRDGGELKRVHRAPQTAAHRRPPRNSFAFPNFDFAGINEIKTLNPCLPNFLLAVLWNINGLRDKKVGRRPRSFSLAPRSTSKLAFRTPGTIAYILIFRKIFDARLRRRPLERSPLSSNFSRAQWLPENQ
jgi:hypothetical protein